MGNTAGTLTTMVETGDSRILVGAGPTRAHAADLIGRTTRPWDRVIDLMIIPGWDDSHAVGALGMLERRSVHSIAVLGLPGNEPVWTMLERRAQADDIRLRYLSSTHRLALSPDVELRLSSLGQGIGAWVRMDYHGMRVDVLDTEDVSGAAPPEAHFQLRNEHLVVNMRSQRAPGFAEPRLLIRPMPFYRDEFQEPHAEFVREIDRNDQLRIELSEGEIRLPLKGVDR